MATSSVKLDAFDLRILATLQRSGRIKKVELAAEIGLSPSPCWERLRRLEKAGIIRGYHADIAIERIVETAHFFVTVTLDSHSASDFRRFESAVHETPEILECHAVGGGVDYVLSVIAPNVAHYQALMERLLAADLRIGQYFTYLVTKPIKRSHGPPLQHLLDLAGKAPRG